MTLLVCLPHGPPAPSIFLSLSQPVRLPGEPTPWLVLLCAGSLCNIRLGPAAGTLSLPLEIWPWPHLAPPLHPPLLPARGFFLSLPSTQTDGFMCGQVCPSSPGPASVACPGSPRGVVGSITVVVVIRAHLLDQPIVCTVEGDVDADDFEGLGAAPGG